MGDSLLRTILIDLQDRFPYVHPSDTHVHPDQHRWLWDMAVAEGRQQVIRYLSNKHGVRLPEPDTEAHTPPDHVLRAQNRGSADSYARSSSSSSASASSQSSG